MGAVIESRRLERRATPGPALHFVSVTPERDTRAIVGVIHGYADHAERYRHVQEAWAERGVGSVAIDLRGHGRAEGARGYCSRFEEFLDDASELTRLVNDRARDAGRFLFGHSFGGLVATQAVLKDPSPYKGLMLSSPFFGLKLELPKVKLVAAKVASRVYPRLALPSGLRGSDVTHDEARGRAYDEDPLVFKNATARWFVETQHAQKAALAAASAIKLPLRVIFGDADPIASYAAGRAFFDAAGSEDKGFESLAGLLHETLNEPSWRTTADALADWVLARAHAN